MVPFRSGESLLAALCGRRLKVSPPRAALALACAVRWPVEGKVLDGSPSRLSFDRLAAVFDDQRSLPPAALAALHEAFARMVDDGLATLIEPGVGTGRIAIPALAAGFRVTALDISVSMLAVFERRLEAAPELRERCELLTGDATALPFASGAFDAGVLAQVLYLIPGWERALDELARVVRPGGRVLLVQERTAMSPALTRWDAAWREATARAGYVAIPQEPDDDLAVAALGGRASDIQVHELASWEFGQTVDAALAGLDRLRPLYDTLDEVAWTAAVDDFRRWHAASGLAADTSLDGTVTLTLASGIVPANPGGNPKRRS
jgi:SAM-dependent methyltransferase